MQSLKDAWFIVRKDMKSDKRYFIWNVLFIAYMALITSTFINEMLVEERHWVRWMIADGVTMFIVPMIGFYFSRRAFKYLQEDSYTQMLSYFRILPISNKVLKYYRLLQVGISLIVNSPIFFATIYLLSEDVRASFDGLSYIAFALTWVGYSILIMAFFIYFEMLSSGRVYFWKTLWIFILMILAAIVISRSDGSFLHWSIDFSIRWGLASPLMWAMLAAGSLGMWLMNIGTYRKLSKRDLQ
ncbi:hypothetical protein [Marinicrinis lubricantis]|uniref:ABC transporter permease n=1 Tax=Marinicrinis lubricantis TaxID=2086470 RepID=A0ABW1ITY9_9BACL